MLKTCYLSFLQSEECRDASVRLAELSRKQLSAALTEKDRARIDRNLKMEYLNIAEVKRLSKPCPGCRIDIHKFDGYVNLCHRFCYSSARFAS